MKTEELELLEQLKAALEISPEEEEKAVPLVLEKPEKLLELARVHAVLPLLYFLCETENNLTKEQKDCIAKTARITVRSNYRLLFLTKYVTEYLQKNGISAIVLKGAATASYYPVPELRKSGDIDILIPAQEEFDRACELLQQAGFWPAERQETLHHLELKNEEGIALEVHRTLAEPFESKKINRYLEQLLKEYRVNVMENEEWGFPFYQSTEAYHAFYLVLHMLQHFLRAGFGIKFLCDWTVFWNRPVAEEQKNKFLQLVEESHTGGFVRILTEACVRYLGLKEENAAFLRKKDTATAEVEEFMREVFEAGEFGHVQEKRMVAMRSGGILAYVREFHHQMHLNYPVAGKIVLFWPVLWMSTLARFVYNNHAVRGVSGREILKEAGKRSRLIEKMKLFS